MENEEKTEITNAENAESESTEKKYVMTSEVRSTITYTFYNLPTLFFVPSSIRGDVYPLLTPLEVLMYSYEHDNMFFPLNCIHTDDEGKKYAHIDFKEMADIFNVTPSAAKRACDSLVKKGVFFYKKGEKKNKDEASVYLRDIASFAYNNDKVLEVEYDW